jgi:hypothetical protein
MNSSKFTRSDRRRPNWSLGGFHLINHQQILASNHDSRIGEHSPGLEEEILEVELFVVLVGPRDITPMSVRSPRLFALYTIRRAHEESMSKQSHLGKETKWRRTQ